MKKTFTLMTACSLAVAACGGSEGGDDMDMPVVTGVTHVVSITEPADGSTVTATLTTDGVAGFQTFAFEGFTDLVSLSWVQVSPFHQFDNIVLALEAAGPVSKDDCRDGGWVAFGFVNQGQCVRMVETGKDSR